MKWPWKDEWFCEYMMLGSLVFGGSVLSGAIVLVVLTEAPLIIPIAAITMVCIYYIGRFAFRLLYPELFKPKRNPNPGKGMMMLGICHICKKEAQISTTPSGYDVCRNHYLDMNEIVAQNRAAAGSVLNEGDMEGVASATTGGNAGSLRDKDDNLAPSALLTPAERAMLMERRFAERRDPNAETIPIRRRAFYQPENSSRLKYCRRRGERRESNRRKANG